MLDLKFVLQNEKLIKENAKNRNVKIDFELLKNLASDRLKFIQDIDNIRSQINKSSSDFKNLTDQKQKEELVISARTLKKDLKQKEEKLRQIELNLKEESYKIPNLSSKDSPIGAEDKNQEIKKVGKIKKFDFKPKDHLELMTNLDIIDFENGANVTGNKFYFLKNEGALLEIALILYGINILRKAGFDFYITPDLAKLDIINGLGFNPRGEESQIYTIDDNKLGLIATSEITLGGLYKDKVIPKENLPIKLSGLSHCFRKESGSYGKASKGLYRVHQFTKLEMFVYSKPNESEKILEELVGIQEKIFKDLGIPFRIVNCATEELGAAAYKKYDLEAWLPGESRWGEITSASNCTDFQARRLNIKYASKDKKEKDYLHTLNATAIAMSRTILAIIENYQNKDGSVKIPKVLQNFMGLDIIKPKE